VRVKSPRRGFLKALAVAPIVPGALAAEASSPQATTQAPGGPGDGVSEALAEAVRRQFGEHLDAAGLEEVRRELERNRGAAARLRAAARLTNGDDPVGRFEARPPVRAPRVVAR
jgi:hypothetical protein